MATRSPAIGGNLTSRLSWRRFLADLLDKSWAQQIIPFVVTVIVIVYFASTTHGFLAGPQLSASSREVAEYTLVAVAEAVVMLGGGFDLSIAATVSVANMLTLILIAAAGMPTLLVLVIVVAAGGAIGLVNGVLVAYLRIQPFLATIGTMIILRAATDLLSLHYADKTITVGTISDTLWLILGQGYVLFLPTPVFAAVVVVVVLQLCVTRSRWGWRLTSVGGSRKAARHSGVGVERILLSSYVISGVLCALAGALYAARLQSASAQTWVGQEIVVLAAVIIGGVRLGGGRGTPLRALLGIVLVEALRLGLELRNVSADVFTMVFSGILLLGVVLDAKWNKHRARALAKISVDPAGVHLPAPSSETAMRGEGGLWVSALSRAEPLGLGDVEGPEDVVLDDSGRLYCGDRRGWIHRFSGPDLSLHEIFARIGGHPLGMCFDGEGNLIVCVSGMGLYAVSPDGVPTLLTASARRRWTSLRDNTPITLADDCDVTPDGIVYFSEATTRFDVDSWMLDALEGRPNGRLMSYDLVSGKTRTVIPSLVFPNGVCVTHEGDSVLVAQTWTCRILRYWHSGSKRGQVEVFVDGFPGCIDNINRASDGSYWVAFLATRSECYDLSMRSPGFRRRMIRQVPVDEWLMPNLNYGGVAKVAPDGSIVDLLWDAGGERHATVTSMREHGGHLYLGGLQNNRVGRISLPSPERSCACGQVPCAEQAGAGRDVAASVGLGS
jgi:ribose transport system permease protein